MTGPASPASDPSVLDDGKPGLVTHHHEPAFRGHDGCHAAARLPVAVRNVDALVTRDRP